MESKVRKGMESANWTKTSPKKGKSSPWNAMMTTAPTEQVDFPTQLILHLIIYSPWVELDYHSHVKRVFEFAVICKAPIHNFPSLRKASLKIFQFRLWDLRPRANARDQLRPWQQIATSPSQVESILPHYRFWDNVTWLELDPFISGPRTVNLCKFWLDLAFECKRPDWKKNIRRIDSPPLTEYLRPFVEATTSGPASGTWAWSSCQWHCFMSPVVINGTLNSDGFRSFHLSW